MDIEKELNEIIYEIANIKYEFQCEPEFLEVSNSWVKKLNSLRNAICSSERLVDFSKALAAHKEGKIVYRALWKKEIVLPTDNIAEYLLNDPDGFYTNDWVIREE